MASVTLDRLYVHLASNHDDYIRIWLESEKERTSKDGEVREYAGGRMRSVVRVGRRQTLAVTHEQMARADVDKLRGYLGKLLLVREPRGRKLWAVFHDIDIDEIAPVDLVNVTLTFHEVTHDEAV